MGLTNELRKYARNCVVRMDGDALRHIADRIDEEAEDNERFRREAGPFCDRLREAAAECADVTLFGVDYIALPGDADGAPIHVGDVLDPPADCDDYMPLQVVRLTYDGYEEEWYFDGEAGGFCGMVGEHMDVAGWTHYHAPTVEDVLREFAQKMNENLGMYTGEAIDADEWRDADAKTVAEYAAKLRLAEDVDV